MKSVRKTLWTMTAITLAGLGLRGCSLLYFRMQTGHWLPIRIEERLQSPLQVHG